MKKMFFGLCLALQAVMLYAQPTLYGVTQDGNGSIVKYDVAADSLSADYRFPSKGNFPGGMIRGQDGLLYGTTNRGGAYGYGVLFSYDPINAIYSVIRSFNRSHGVGPKSRLTQAPNGILFGVAQGVDDGDRGLIFSYNLQSKVFKVFHRFTPFENYARLGTMVVAPDGNLYGTTEQTIFQINPVASTYKTVYTEPDFLIHFGITLTLASDGLLYGTTDQIDVSSTGTIISFNTATNALTKLFNMDPATTVPSFGMQGLTESQGRLYGYNHLGIYSLTINTKTVTRHASFDPGQQVQLRDPLVKALDGMMYSAGIVSPVGDDYERWQGLVYRFNPMTNSGTTIKKYPDGSQLNVMLQVPNGKWYSTFTSNSRLLGTIVSMDNTFTTSDLYRFRQNPGAIPSGALIEYADGMLYGAAREGGVYDKGVLYSFNIKTKQQNVLKSFTGTDGQSPSGGLCRGMDGKLYGVTMFGGANGYGILYSYDVSMSTYKLVKTFDAATGGNPEHGLIADANGILYGVTKAVAGTTTPVLSYLYSYNPANNVFTVLTTNTFQAGQLTFGKDGNIYMFSNGGGRVLKYDPVSKSKQEYPVNATADIGYETFGGLHQAPNGLFYGMTNAGTTNRVGTLFSFNAATGAFNVLYAFSTTDGNGHSPHTTLMTGSDGLLYGLTYKGGANNMGTLFSFDTKSNQLKKLEDFDEYTGGLAAAGSLIELNLSPFISISDAKVYESDGNAAVTVSLSKPSIYNIVVELQMKSGTAINWGSYPDYIPMKTKMIFSAGKLTSTLNIRIIKDEVAEPEESFNVLLTNLTPTRALLVDSVSIVTITDGVRPSTSFNQPGATEVAVKANEFKAGGLSLTVLPNPSSTAFSFDLITAGDKPAQFRIYDQAGRIVETRSNLRSGRLNAIGSKFIPGVYYAELKQGSESKVIKLIKE